ncbi:transcriptional regulator [Microaerobacter geothermalis]|uniref:BTAD domain-containing putative transcriptional regulator n=1 Tax=Microaerobacter geothermalis TaxID=674972 RepID=UPI001F1BEC5D|nr:BTAD domain-containing putative transcriptional regulator [Microaerobacter geothermalis]MCF6092813.1 transcriptional regulator [Microaerobacter geothermalis]
MSGRINILNTKLLPPRLKHHILRRPSLTRKMKQLIDYPLTLIHSGPGYGKSTAISSFLRDQTISYCWYSISENDDEIIPFVTYLIHALRTQVPSFGGEWLEKMTKGERFIREEEIRSLCSEFVNELTFLSRELLLVLDDFHLVEHSAGIRQWMVWFIQHLPEHIHLVVSSRTRPDWDLLTQMKVKGNLLELTEKDLAFKEEEIDVLFSDSYEFPLTPNQVKQIYKKTEGWVIAIQMIWQQLMAKGDLKKILESNAESMEDLFSFLAMEVLMKQPYEIQRFLLETSIFDPLTESVCDEVIKQENSRQMLEMLSNKNLFLIHVGDHQYRYHALFKDFLQQELKKNVYRYVELHRLAARYYQSNNQQDQAIFHLQSIGEHEALAELLHTYGRKMLENGQLESLLEIVQKIPVPVKDRYSLIWVYEGEVYRFRCLYENAMGCYTKAEELARDAGDAYGESAALEGQAKIYLDTIQPGKADFFLKKAIQVMNKIEDPLEETRIRLYSFMTENLINSGRATEAGKWFGEIRKIRSDFQDQQLEARLHLRTGKLQSARKILERGKQDEDVRDQKHLSRSHRETDLLLSLIHSFMGEPEKAKILAETGIMQGVKCKAPFVEAVGWMRMGHAVQMLTKYDLEMAIHCYKTSLEIMDQLNVSRGKAEPLMGLSLLHGYDGSLDLTVQYGEQALAETERVNDFWLSTLIRLGMGVSYVNHQQWQQALLILEQCKEAFNQCGDSYGLTVTYLWQSMMFFFTEDWNSFDKYMGRFLKLMQLGEYEFLIQNRTMFGPRDIQRIVPLLLEAQKRKVHGRYVSRLLTELGIDNVNSHPGYTLRVQTLGKFRVWLGEKEVEEKDWQRGKAKELFQLMITKRQKLLPKEKILSLLWPELDEKAGSRDFKVALNALNKALEPNRTARSAPFFIQREGSSYGLNFGTGIQLDTMEFERWIQDGLEEKDHFKARIWLQQGLEFYEGDYLPDRLYDDWCIEERERFKDLFLRGAERLAQLYVEVEDYDQAIPWCEEILKKDPCWEEAYRLLMFCYYQKKNRSQALKWYQRCCDHLEKEMGVSPMITTKQMYTMIKQME